MAANCGRSLRSRSRSVRRRSNSSAALARRSGISASATSVSPSRFSTSRKGASVTPFAAAVALTKQKISDVRSNLDRQPRPIFELGDGVLCIERLSPRVQQSQLVRVALDKLRQDGNVVIAQVDEARLLEPDAFLVFRLRIRDFHAGRQAAVFEPDDNDEQVALRTSSRQTSIGRSARAPKNSIALCRCWTRRMASSTASRSCSRSSKVLQTNTANKSDIGFPP